MRLINTNKSKQVIAELESRFIDGERLTIDEIVKEYFDTKSFMNHLQAQKVVRGWINGLKSKFTKKYELWFGSINDLGQFGIANTEAEFRFAGIRYYQNIKGNVKRATQLVREGQSKGLLPGRLPQNTFQVTSLIPLEETTASSKKK